MTWANGSYYEGEFYNDLKHGYGLYKWVIFYNYSLMIDFIKDNGNKDYKMVKEYS